MPNIANTFDEKQYKQVKSKFQNDLRTILPQFSKVLEEKKDLDKNFELSLYIKKNIKTDYSYYLEMAEFDDAVDMVSSHYKEKFKKTEEPKYNIVTFRVGAEYHESSSESDLSSSASSLNSSSSVSSQQQVDDFKKLITDNMPKTENPQGIVFYSEMQAHTTPALLTHDNKIIIFNLSEVDSHIIDHVENYIKLSNLDTKIVYCQSVFDNIDHSSCDIKDSNPQKDAISCIIFAHKYLKLLGEDDYKLFKSMKLSPDNNNIYVLPPELLRYSQSDSLVQRYLDKYQRIFRVPEEQIETLIDYRDDKFGKFRILYHHIKNYTGNTNKQSKIIHELKTLTTNLEHENANFKEDNLFQEH